MKQILIWALTFLFIACNSSHKKSSVVTIDVAKDTCYILSDYANRQIEIVENTIEDTIILGFAILPPKYLGKFDYLRLDERVDISIYPETPKSQMPKTKIICVNLFENRKNKGKIIIRLTN